MKDVNQMDFTSDCLACMPVAGLLVQRHCGSKTVTVTVAWVLCQSSVADNGEAELTEQSA
jgi:hypothetical protein